MKLNISNHFIVEPHIIHETINDDTVIINIKSGFYYSLSNAASSAWNLLVAGNTIEATTTTIAKLYNKSPEQITSDILDLANELDQENLIKINENQQNLSSKDLDLINSSYEKPSIKKYTDMEALLLADPVHEFIDE